MEIITTKYENIYFPMFGRYEVKIDGAVTKAGDTMEIIGVAVRFNGLVFASGNVFFKVSREGVEPFETSANLKTVTARYIAGHYVGVPGVISGRFDKTSGNADHAMLHHNGFRLKEGSNLFEFICGHMGKTVRVKSLALSQIKAVDTAFPCTSFYKREDYQ